jgi:hypothetical protein
VNPLELLRDVLSRLVAARESLEYGDVSEAAQILYELEIDLVGELEGLRRAA